MHVMFNILYHALWYALLISIALIRWECCGGPWHWLLGQEPVHYGWHATGVTGMLPQWPCLHHSSHQYHIFPSFSATWPKEQVRQNNNKYILENFGLNILVPLSFNPLRTEEVSKVAPLWCNGKHVWLWYNQWSWVQILGMHCTAHPAVSSSLRVGL